MKNKFLEAMKFRHACKLFDEKKKLSKDDLEFILEAGRLSPSSFGMEHWRFVVAQSDELKEKLQSACYGQPQLTTCSDAVVILAIVDEIKPGNDYVKEMFNRRDLPEDKLKGYLEFYKSVVDSYDIRWWSISQCHIAAANMMTAAAAIGIDSCPIGGFEPDKVKEVLGITDGSREPALIVPLGYRVNPQTGKKRLSKEEIIEYR